MKRTAVLNVVGLTPRIVGSAAAPNLARWAAGGAFARIRPAFPAVTCTAQSDYLTGRYPATHGIVGNGWYAREDAEIKFWKQSNRLVQAPKIWERAKRSRPGVHVRQPLLVVQHVLDRGLQRHAAADVPRRRPEAARHLHRARRLCATNCRRSSARFRCSVSGDRRRPIESTRWIAEAAKHVEQKFSPTLSLVYLPHLDYNLQRVGPSAAAAAVDVQQVDDALRRSHRLLRGTGRPGRHPVGVRLVRCHDARAHQPRAARARLIAVRDELGLEVLDPGASAAFAVADHQVAHVYVNDPSRQHEVRALLETTPGVEHVLDAEGKARARHRPRARRRPRRHRRAERVVHLLLLARRPARAGLRAHRRHPPQARLRPRRAVPRSGDSGARR